MNVAELKKQLKSDALSNVYLFFGEEAYLKNKYLNEIRKKTAQGAMGDFNTYVFELCEYKIEAMDDMIEQLPVMAEKKLIVIKDSRLFSSSKKAKTEYREYWDRRIKDIPDDSCILFYEDEVDKRGSLYKYIDKNYCCVEFSFLEERDMANWVGKLLLDEGKKMEDIRHFLSCCDGSMENVIREIQKLVSYTGGRETITREDVGILVTKPIQNRIFEVVDAIITKKRDFVFAGLNDMYRLKESPVKILSILAGHFDKLLKIKYLKKEGVPDSLIGERISERRPFLVRKFLEQADRFELKWLRMATELCGECDTKLKSSAVKPETELQVFLCAVLSQEP